MDIKTDSGRIMADGCERNNLGSKYARARLCCTNHAGDSLYESSVIAGRHEQLDPYEVQDQELAFVQHSAEATRIAVDLV